MMSNLQAILSHYNGKSWAQGVFEMLDVDDALLLPVAETVLRVELAQALNMILFDDLVARVPAAEAYTRDAMACGKTVNFDHGALRTVKGFSGQLPPGEAAVTRVLRALGYRHNGTYPLNRLRMTGRSWCHEELPDRIAQFFVSELHPERFSEEFQKAVERVIGNSRDPLTPRDIALLEQLARDGELPLGTALELLSAMVSCFARQHAIFSLADYEVLLAESAEMAWIATEGNVFNHATDRVVDVQAVAEEQRRLGRPIKGTVEVSQSGRVRQTAFRAATVSRHFLHEGAVVERLVPGSFYEFISRDHIVQQGAPSRLDLQFDAGNATGIFAMTSADRVTA